MPTFETSPTKEEIGLGDVQNIKNNFTAVADPAISNDSTQGYTAGSLWINTVTDEAFICTDATAGSAVWVSVTAGSGGGNTEELVLLVEKGSPGTINPGQVVRISGYDPSSGYPHVELAQSNSSATMPAIGLARDSFTHTTQGRVVISGILSGLATTGLAAGAELFVDSTTPGALTNVKPTGTGLIQKVAIVVRNHPSAGVVEVIGAGRVNDLPNLALNNLWMGNASGVPTQTSRAGIDSTATRLVGSSEDDTTTSTASAAYVNKFSYISPSLTGDHMVTWSMIFGSTSSGKRVWAKFRNVTDAADYSEVGEDGVGNVGDSDMLPTAAFLMNIAGSKRVTFTGSPKTFAFQYKQTEGGTTVIARAARIAIYKI